MSIAIVGAGPCGLACADMLRRAGKPVVVFEKSRGLGGRLATRRRGGLAFDHGTPHLKRADRGGAGARTLLSRLTAASTATERDGRIYGLPGMSALVAPLSEGLDIRRMTRITRLVPSAEGWRLEAEDDRVGAFEAVALAIPAPQVVDLLSTLKGAAPPAARMAPLWTVMAAFDAPVQRPDTIVFAKPPLAEAICDSAKPGRAAAPQCWTIHASAAWSLEHLEDERETVGAALIAAFRAETGAPAPVHLDIHRWRYARVAEPQGTPVLRAAPALFAGGDWALGATAGDAIDSGLAMAQAILDR